jgi:hypothetical protein
MLSGLPLFDLFSKMGVTMGLGANQLLIFDVAKLNKVRPAESRPGACSRSLRSLCQVGLDPTMTLSLLSKFSDVVTPGNSNSTAILFYTPPLCQDNHHCQIYRVSKLH